MSSGSGSGPRVLVVSPLYHTDRGGLGRQAVLLTERLASLGVRALVATRRMTGLPPRAFSPLVEVVPVDAGRTDVHNYEAASARNLATSLRFSLGLARVMERRRRDYDLLHFHGASLPLLSALPLARALGKRVVAKVAALHQGVEAGDLRRRYGPAGPCLAWAFSQVDAYVATTDEIARALRGEGYAAEKIARIPNFVDPFTFRRPTEAERAGARAALRVADRTVVLCSGRLTARKAADVLLRAFARALPRCDAGRPPLLLFLGDGPERPGLEALARDLGLAGPEPAPPAESARGARPAASVRFDGFQVDVPRFLAAADVLALPSLVEGLPNALLEGMAAGLPVVATRLGGALDVVVEGETGLLVPPGDEGALADGLVALLRDPARRAALGAAGARRIEERYTIDAIAPRYLELYARLTGRAAAGAELAHPAEQAATHER